MAFGSRWLFNALSSCCRADESKTLSSLLKTNRRPLALFLPKKKEKNRSGTLPTTYSLMPFFSRPVSFRGEVFSEKEKLMRACVVFGLSLAFFE